MRLERRLDWAIRNGENGSQPGGAKGASDGRYESATDGAHEQSIAAIGRNGHSIRRPRIERTSSSVRTGRRGVLERVAALETRTSQSSAGTPESVSGTSDDRVR